MKLDTPYIRSVHPERLVRDLGAARQDARTGGRLEDVVVPLIDTGRRLEVTKEGIVGRRLGRDDLEPADLGLRGARDGAPERSSEELRTEADSEHGHVLFDSALEQQALAPEERHRLLVPGMGVPAHGDDGGDLADVHILDTFVPGPQAAVQEAGGLESLAEQAEAAKGVLLLDDEDGLHGRDANRDSGVESSARPRKIGLMATTTTKARPSIRPEALEAASAFPALEAIFTRRARRFALGAELTGPLAFRSDKEPVPLAYEEEAILVAAATGITGVVREEWPFRTAEDGPTGADKLASFTGRSFPSPLAIHGTEVFWTNDDGVFVLPQRDVKPERYVQLQTQQERHELYRQAVKLQEGRLDIPRRRPNLFKFNEWLVNTEGATVFIPVSDVTRQCISAMLLYFDRPHGYYLVDKQLGNDPLRPFVRSGLLSPEHPVDLWDFERWQMVDMNGVEEGLVVENLMIATQALGIGGHPFSGGKGRVTLGGEKYWHEIGGEGTCGTLGFTFHRVPDDAPVGAGEEIPVGLEGIFEGACPPFHRDMDAAVDDVLDLRWGKEGIFSTPAAQQVPWRSPEVARGVPRPSEEAVEATKTLCRYIWDTYGRFPATIDPFLMTVWYQAAHLDVDFYDRYYPPEALPAHVRTHLHDWHGL
jgi:hypothetical protein